LRVSVKTALVVPLLPSTTVVSSMTIWRPESSSKIVPKAEPSTRVRVGGALRVRVRESLPSTAASPMIGTVNGLNGCAGRERQGDPPLPCSRSPAVAVLLLVAKLIVTATGTAGTSSP
jgi:hypothetical protein